MTKFSYSEVQPAYTSSQCARLESLPSFNTVEATLEQFASSTSLTGPGWDSAKQALAPYSLVSKALHNYHCDFGEIFASFLASFESEVGETSKTLDTEELADLQAKINRLQQEKQDLLLKIAGNIALEIIGGYGVMYKDFQIDQKQKKVDLLQKYEAFENTHANDFSEIKAIGTQLKTALSDLGKAKQFNAKTGKYSKIEYTNYEWYQKLSDYNDSCPTQRMEIVAEYQEAAGHGLTVYKVYIDGKYNEEASNNLQWLMLQDSLKMVVDIGGELTGVYDLYRLFFGKDPVTGGAASRLEAGLWTALLLLPTGKIVEGIKEIRAGNRLLKGMDLTADELRILNKAGYFEDVSKIEKIEKAANSFRPQKITLNNGEIAYKSKDGILVRSADYLDEAGNIKWPNHNGFELDELGEPIVKNADLKKGKILDRYGAVSGTFTSPVENGQVLNYESRGLPYPESVMEYHQYEVVKDINIKNVQQGFDNLSLVDQQKLKQLMSDYGFNLEDMANPQSGKIAEVFGSGGGTQIKLGTSVSWYEKLGILKEIK